MYTLFWIIYTKDLPHSVEKCADYVVALNVEDALNILKKTNSTIGLKQVFKTDVTVIIDDLNQLLLWEDSKHYVTENTGIQSEEVLNRNKIVILRE